MQNHQNKNEEPYTWGRPCRIECFKEVNEKLLGINHSCLLSPTSLTDHLEKETASSTWLSRTQSVFHAENETGQIIVTREICDVDVKDHLK
jgi:hypothetical protein